MLLHCPSWSLRSGSLGGTLERTLDYGPYGESLGTDWAATSAPAARKLFIGKEKLKSDDTELYDFGARRYDPTLPRWTSADPLAGKYPGISPYAYCANNPINRIDPSGQKDTSFVKGYDLEVYEIPGTETPIDKKSINNSTVYNCHSFAWEETNGDPLDPRNAYPLSLGAYRWDNNPDNNMAGFEQLDNNEPNKKGDRVLYYVDSNQNGIYDPGEVIEHSAVVWEVDQNGYTTVVVSKLGEGGISFNHPRADRFYNVSPSTKSNTSRAYFRFIGMSKSPQVFFPFP